MARNTAGATRFVNPKKKRPGVVSKNNTSNHKQSKNYKKAYRGQGRR